ncbi:MAG: URC4/urg3 family protein [Myxococcota bacterium]|nr:URC4/urg3 family protein [Myxococcota bacterium]
MSAAELLNPEAIRERCGRIFEAGRAGKLEHFTIDEAALEGVADRVAATTKQRYPDLAIPYHGRLGHLRVGGADRPSRAIDSSLDVATDADERGRRLFELVITSVLLDAGAGMAWRFVEDGVTYARSEGLAVASAHLFAKGAFSSTGDASVDAAGLEALATKTIADGFQVTADNPLVGVEGRAELLRSLGRAVRARPDVFGTDGRLGGLFDFLRTQASEDVLPARSILIALLDALGTIWPSRISLGGVPLGDVWKHPAAGGEGDTRGLVPFHKLSQWLSYSLLEPLEGAGVTVTDLDRLTGLAEYRNGGLFVDAGVLVPKHDAVLRDAHGPSSPVIVEWRALTVVLLDRVAPLVRARLGADLPLAKILEGGTWHAGREIARELRSDGGPPIRLDSDGTVF